MAIPGVIQFVSGLGVDEPVGGVWTGMMILTYLIAMMGIQATPTFTMWAFSNKSPKPFAPQQVCASALGIGLILMVFTAIQGLGGHLLGADSVMNSTHPELVNNVMTGALTVEGSQRDLMEMAGQQEFLVPILIWLLKDSAPWLVGLLAVCALAAMQSTGAAAMSTTGGMVTRDVLKRFIMPRASHAQQKLAGRLGVLFIVIAALIVASTATDALVLLGNLGAALLISALTQNSADREHRMGYHRFLKQHAGLPQAKRSLVPLAWIITLVWFFFGIGPGAVIGNTLFGDPNDAANWLFGMPSIWLWQIIWWALGVFMIWFLAYRMELSTVPDTEIEALHDDIGDAEVGATSTP